MKSDLTQPLTHADSTHVVLRGKHLAYFGGCDYFRLSWHPKIRKTLATAITRWGITTAASRKTTGNHPLYQELESKLASFFGAESAVLVSNGYATGIAVAQGLAGNFSKAYIDARAHGCLADSLPFFGCASTPFSHQDPIDLAGRLKRHPPKGKVVILTDGLFSHNGSVAPVRRYLECLPENAMLIIDDAHGAGVLGEKGRGTLEHERVGRNRIIQTLTLSKAFGLYGGVILCDRPTRERIVQRSALFTGNTPLPLPLAAAAFESLTLLRAGSPLRQRLHANTRRIKEALQRGKAGLSDRPGPVVSYIPKNSSDAATLSRRLLAAEIFPSHIRYPGGPENGYFRFAISSAHTADQLDRLADALNRE